MQNGEVSEIISGQPLHPVVMEGRRRPRPYTASGIGTIAALAVARYLEERKQG